MRCTELRDQLQKANVERADNAYEWAEDFAKLRDRKDAYKYKAQEYGEVIKRQKVQIRNLQLLVRDLRDQLDDEDENAPTVLISDDDSTGMQVLWERN